MKKESIVIRGWKAVPREDGKFNIYGPGSYDDYRGLAHTLEQAIGWLNDSSGVTYDSLPAVKRSELVCQTTQQPIAKFPYRRNDKVVHYHYSHNGKLLGTIQHKEVSGKIETITIYGESCILGADLRWLCEQNGLRLVDNELVAA